MGYPLQQLQATAQHIVNLYRYENGKTLTRNEKKWATQELLQQLYNLSYIQKKVMLIDPSNQKLAGYFDSLSYDKIVFPSNHRFMVKVNGVSFDKHIIARLSFDEQAELVADRIAQDCSNTCGTLSAYQLEFAQEAIKEWLEDLKSTHKGTIRIEAKNHGCDELFEQLASKGILFPKKTAYLMKPHGECLKQQGKNEELLCSPVTESLMFYEYKKSKKLRRQKKSEFLLNFKNLSLEDSESFTSHQKPMTWQYSEKKVDYLDESAVKVDESQRNQSHPSLKLR